MKNLLAILLLLVISCVSTQETKEEPKKENKKKFNREEVCNDLNNKSHVDQTLKDLLCR